MRKHLTLVGCICQGTGRQTAGGHSWGRSLGAFGKTGGSLKRLTLGAQQGRSGQLQLIIDNYTGHTGTSEAFAVLREW